MRLNSKIEDRNMNDIVQTFLESYRSKKNSEIISPAFADLLQANVTRKFFRGLLDFYKFPISEFPDVHNLLSIDGFVGLSGNFRSPHGKFPCFNF